VRLFVPNRSGGGLVRTAPEDICLAPSFAVAADDLGGTIRRISRPTYNKLVVFSHSSFRLPQNVRMWLNTRARDFIHTLYMEYDPGARFACAAWCAIWRDNQCSLFHSPRRVGVQNRSQTVSGHAMAGGQAKESQGSASKGNANGVSWRTVWQIETDRKNRVAPQILMQRLQCLVFLLRIGMHACARKLMHHTGLRKNHASCPNQMGHFWLEGPRSFRSRGLGFGVLDRCLGMRHMDVERKEGGT
jgi:hypothetical protein